MMLFGALPRALCRSADGPSSRKRTSKRKIWRFDSPNRRAASITPKRPSFTCDKTSIRFNSRSLIIIHPILLALLIHYYEYRSDISVLLIGDILALRLQLMLQQNRNVTD